MSLLWKSSTFCIWSYSRKPVQCLIQLGSRRNVIQVFYPMSFSQIFSFPNTSTPNMFCPAKKHLDLPVWHLKTYAKVNLFQLICFPKHTLLLSLLCEFTVSDHLPFHPTHTHSQNNKHHSQWLLLLVGQDSTELLIITHLGNLYTN